MSSFPEGNAIVYCEGAFGTTNGKTAHGLVRRTKRYNVLSVIDSRHAGKDAGQALDGSPKDIPIFSGLEEAIDAGVNLGSPPTHFVMGLTPDGGRLSAEARQDVIEAVRHGLNVDCGLHDFLSEDPEISEIAKEKGVQLRDIRKTPPRNELHPFTGNIEKVKSLKVAILGTDSAVGKRTTAWVLIDALQESGYTAEMVGTGQTSWLQGARYCIMMDSLINDFVAGEIENAVWSAWKDNHPDVIVIEGQGSLMNPAYPGGFEILAAGRPDVVILQHAPARKDYDGFPGYPIHPINKQIRAVEVISEKPVVAIAINHENLGEDGVKKAQSHLEKITGLPAVDVLLHGAGRLVEVLKPKIPPNTG
jgi:uncharacterized NAD-dependent epimerase/dehydratase family protein